MKRIKFTILAIILLTIQASAQLEQIGSSNLDNRNTQGNLFDYSDPQAINIKVSIWGYVKSPGRYIIPVYTTTLDLISYAGGPAEGATLDDLRIYRVLEDGTQQLFKFDFDDLMNEESLSSKTKTAPELKAGDYLMVPGAPKLYFQDWLGISLNVLSAILSITLFVISATN